MELYSRSYLKSCIDLPPKCALSQRLQSSMCVIERFDVVHPNGFREQKEHLHYCEWGSPVTPCNAAIVEVTEDRFLPLEPPLASEPYIHEVSPRGSQHSGRRKARKFTDGLKLVWNIHIPFTSKKTGKKKTDKKPEYIFVQRRRSGRGRHSPRHNSAPVPGPIEMPREWPPYPGAPGIGRVPEQLPPQSPARDRRPRARTIRPRDGHPLNVEVHQQGSSSSPSPKNPPREHVRQRSRTEAELREYEEHKRLVRERERREHAERRAREAENARLRAERDAERLRRHDAEEARWQAEEEQRRIRYKARKHLESAERQRRRLEQEESEREQARLRQLQEDRERMQAAAISADRRRRRDREERERLDRLRRSNIPRGPRHRPTVHQRPRVSFEEREDRGSRVINDAIMEEQRRRFEHPLPPGGGWPRRRDVGGGMRRRDTVAVWERIVYEDDLRRGGRRFI